VPVVFAGELTFRVSGIVLAANGDMRPARCRTTTLADVQSGVRGETCAVCCKELRAGQPVAWGLANQRLHEQCLDGLRASRLRPSDRPTSVAASLRGVLARHEGRLCAACLALEIGVSLEQAREVVHHAAAGDGIAVLPVACGVCGRETDVVCTIGPGAR
jgi:hypothetical protein